jgi:arylsulfatase
MEPEFTAPSFQPDLLGQVGPGEIEHPIPWEQLTDEHKRFQATKMAIHAAMIDRMDQEIGRVLDQVRAMGAWDNTIVIFLSDNGTSAEMMVRGDGNNPAAAPGSAGSFLCLGPGWSSAGNSPFRRHKMWTHEGGISTPLIVLWPRGLSAHGELRHDVGHVIDIVPTLLELAGVKAVLPDGAPPFPGRSLVASLSKDGAVTRECLFFSHNGNRALRMGDYKIVSAKLDHSEWELYNLATDRCEQHDLAAEQPGTVSEMASRWKQLQASFVRDAGPVVPKDITRPRGKKAAAVEEQPGKSSVSQKNEAGE